MKNTKYLIIGNGIAGLSAAREISNNDKEGNVIMISSEPHLTYYRMKLTEGLEKNYTLLDLLVNKEDWYSKRNIELLLSKIVVKLDVENKMITLDDGLQITYEKLLIATGSRPFIPPINGKFKEGVFALRTFSDLQFIKEYISNKETITVIGGGLLGLEAAWSLKLLGKKVNVVEFAPYLLPRQLDEELGLKLGEMLSKEGINVYLPRSAEEIMGEGKATGIRIKGGEEILSDAILVSSGIRPNLDLVRDTPIAFDKGIYVDEHLQTNIKDIYAAGDVAEFNNVVVGLWTTGNEQGKIAGANIAGGDMKYKEPKPFSNLRLGNIQIFSAGNIVDFDKVLEYKDGSKDIHHKLYIKNEKMVGVILTGDLKEQNTLKKAVFNHDYLEDYLLTGLAFK